MDRASLMAVLQAAWRLVSKDRYGQLSGVIRLGADAEELLVEATNYEESLVDLVPIEDGEVSPSICVQANSLLGVVKALPRGVGEVRLEIHEDRVGVGPYWIAKVCPAKEFPDLPELPRSPRATVELPEDFEQVFKFVRRAVADGPSRYSLEGVCFDFSHGRITATDGKRMHSAPLGDPLGLEHFILRPRAFDLGSVTHLVVPRRPEEGELSHVFLLTPTGYISTIPLNGEFPEYWAVVRDEHFTKAVVSRAELLATVQQVLPVLDPKSQACALHLNEGLEVTSTGQDARAAFSSSVPAIREGREIAIHVNAYFLRDALDGLPGEEVTLWFREPGEAVHMMGERDAWAVIMPVKIEDSETAGDEAPPSAEGAASPDETPDAPGSGDGAADAELSGEEVAEDSEEAA